MAYLNDFKNTPSEPPDSRVSLVGIKAALEISMTEASRVMDELIERAYVRSWKAGRIKFYKLTAFGAAELGKRTETWVDGEASTSRIGLSVGKKVVTV